MENTRVRRPGHGLRDGSQTGKKEGGLRRNENTCSCNEGGPGYGRGDGRGRGKNRRP